jgi:hypothetical protein
MNATVKVIKGCPDLFTRKSDAPVHITFEATDVGVKVKGLGRTLWMAGNRRSEPKLKYGQTFNLNNGNPLKFVTIEITDF